MKKIYTGGCLCGDIRYEVDGKIVWPHTCSCKMCQRHTGALTALWVEVAADNLKWVGKGGKPKLFRSSKNSQRAFCAKCGSSLGAIDDKPTIGLLVGTMDKNNSLIFSPESHSYTSTLPKWWKRFVYKEIVS
ncbi:MAG: GFA family protein [Proteobacteria bacterium]|nr:GFA family protein [Pseudomonadota bacterium]